MVFIGSRIRYSVRLDGANTFVVESFRAQSLVAARPDRSSSCEYFTSRGEGEREEGGGKERERERATSELEKDVWVWRRGYLERSLSSIFTSPEGFKFPATELSLCQMYTIDRVYLTLALKLGSSA
ncbi:hypothetical protein EYF80_018440 [Liparis tanakae]|uniref:Uncharacterized protein n=1 Tax=Liparis tanakae TaxID=230148 RepID=A0A4Z2I2A9_9TELE|nr:hypothetical protein EYF80_018440 [Liparis tanakae]